MNVREQQASAAQRYRDHVDEREEIERRREATQVNVVDSREQLERRAGRLIENGRIPASVLVKAVREAESGGGLLLERIIGEKNDLQPVTFLVRGTEVARTIARIAEDRPGAPRPFGTGSLVGRHLLLTNNHVLPNEAAARASVAEFDCDPGRPPSEVVLVRFDPDRLFVTDEHLDVTLVALQPLDDGRAPGDEFGWNRLISQQGKIVTGEPVNVVGHPMGRTKEIAVRNNELSDQLEDFLHYSTDTEPGNSGSPVFNDEWEVVALHHAGVPATNEQGEWLRHDGQVWQRSDGDAQIHWVANEGARVSRILHHLDAVAADGLTDDARRLLRDELGAGADGVAVPAGPSHVAIPPVAPPDDGGTPVDRRDATDGDSAELLRRRRARQPAGRSGLAATGAPFGGDVQLVFLHGRSQQGLDPEGLRRSWAGGLARGLTRIGERAPDASDVWFPYYGDAFAAALDTRERLDPVGQGEETAEALAPDAAGARSLYETMLREAADLAGLPPALLVEDADHRSASESRLVGGAVSRLQRQLTWLANRSGLDDRVIARFFRDVAAYLDDPDLRELVLSTVLAEVPDHGRVALVCHSLGTVVGMDLLTRLPDDVEVVHLVTAGSPLGMDSINKRLLSGGPHPPGRIGAWTNVWCAADAVAIGCPLQTAWGPIVTEVVTDNPKDRAHDIEEYLADGRVAATVRHALDRA